LPEAQDKFNQEYYNTWNRNKLGITLNLDKPEAWKWLKLVKISMP
jgi:crotonobetainyl-CoA:carnitine CoA-transferase CaiB-like acyl-CoA transferase